MRLLAVLFAFAFMYVGVPMLWQMAMVSMVKEMSAEPMEFPVSNEPITANIDTANLIAGINPSPDFNVEEAEAFGAQAAADRTMRDISAAQDAAAKARYP